MSNIIINYFGPTYWGFVVNTMLLGTTYVQTYIYFNQNKDAALFHGVVRAVNMNMWCYVDDSTLSNTNPSQVLAVVTFDTLGTALIATTIYRDFLVNFGNYAALEMVPNTMWLELGTTSVITAMVQIFFATRIYLVMRQYPVLTKLNMALPLSVTITAIGGLGFGLARIVYLHLLPVQEHGSLKLAVPSYAEEGFVLLGDLISTVTLCYILSSTPGGVQKTHSRIRQLFFFLLTRGILVTILQIGTLAAFSCNKSGLYWMPFHLCKSKLYTNTFLAMLNSRKQPEQ